MTEEGLQEIADHVARCRRNYDSYDGYMAHGVLVDEAGELVTEVLRLRRLIARVRSACGIQDPAEACRTILDLTGEKAPSQRGKGGKR